MSDIPHFELGSGSNDSRGAFHFIEYVCKSIVYALQDSASRYVPKHHVNFYKLWWSRELSCLKEKTIISDKLWKDAG